MAGSEASRRVSVLGDLPPWRKVAAVVGWLFVLLIPVGWVLLVLSYHNNVKGKGAPVADWLAGVSVALSSLGLAFIALWSVVAVLLRVNAR